MGEQDQSAKQGKAASPEPEGKVSWFRAWLMDVIYTLNHALSCLFTDSLIQPFVGAAVEEGIAHNEKWPKWLRWVGKIFESHSHHHEHHHDHKPPFWSNVKHWFSGEIVGDLTAVPVTATIARLCPWLMNGIRNVLEPMTGRLFEKGAERDAIAWAKKHGFDPHGPEAEAKKKELRNYEMNHSGHIVVWNTLSTIFNVEWQLFRRSKGTTHGHEHHKHEATRPELYFGKIFGLMVSNILLLTARVMKPGFFQRNEEAIGKVTGKLLGAKEEPEVQPEDSKKPHSHDADWVKTVRTDRMPSPQSISLS